VRRNDSVIVAYFSSYPGQKRHQSGEFKTGISRQRIAVMRYTGQSVCEVYIRRTQKVASIQ